VESDGTQHPVIRINIQGGQGIQVGENGTQYNTFQIENYYAEQNSAINNEFFDHVPESRTEIDYVIGHRPAAWEYLMYAGVLQVGLHDARQKSENRQASRLPFLDGDAALRYMPSLMSELRNTTQ
jgi:hypothetical protein